MSPHLLPDVPTKIYSLLLGKRYPLDVLAIEDLHSAFRKLVWFIWDRIN